MTSARDLRLLRASLVLVWLGTALASALEAHGRSAELLAAAGLPPGPAATLALWAGIALDAAIGLVLWRAPPRAAATAGLAGLAVMTLAATVVLPGAWLDPLGAMLKNLPIAAALLVLRRNS